MRVYYDLDERNVYYCAPSRREMNSLLYEIKPRIIHVSLLSFGR